MGRESKKEAVAALHRNRIMESAEKLFSQKGYDQTTIEDISKESEYSRRTIYSYFESKDDILHHIIEKGLQTLKQDIEDAVDSNDEFVAGYRAICMAMRKYHKEYPHSIDRVNSAYTSNLEISNTSDTLKNILDLGTEINKILEEFIEAGKKSKVVRKDVVPMLTVYVMWSSINSFLTLVDTKGKYICKQFDMSEDELLDYGFKQIINSILENKEN